MIPWSGLENTRHVALSQVCRAGSRKEVQTPGRLPASASCPAAERKAIPLKGKDSGVEKKNQKSGVMRRILFPVEPGRTKRGCTRLNPSPAEEDGRNSRTDGQTDGDGQHDQPAGSSPRMFPCSSPHCPASGCAFPHLDFLLLLVSLRRGCASKTLKMKREEVPERANQAEGAARRPRSRSRSDVLRSSEGPVQLLLPQDDKGEVAGGDPRAGREETRALGRAGLLFSAFEMRSH